MGVVPSARMQREETVGGSLHDGRGELAHEQRTESVLHILIHKRPLGSDAVPALSGNSMEVLVECREI